MFGSDIVEVAIALIFVYFTLSLICSMLTEWTARSFAMRSDNLEKGLKNMLQDDEMVKKIYEHPLIAPTFKEGERTLRKIPLLKRLPQAKGNRPSYIAPRNFALALLDVVTEGSESRAAEGLNAAIKGLPGESNVEKTLQIFMAKAEDKLDGTIDNVELWFDDVMERVGGWYTRKAQLITIGFALVVAVVLNADSIMIARTLISDVTVRQLVVGAAEKVVADSAERALEGDEEQAKLVTDLKGELESLGIPLGWLAADEALEDVREVPQGFTNWLTKAAGLLLTTFAISLGAPFWFDLLGKVSNIKGTGKKPLTTLQETALIGE